MDENKKERFVRWQVRSLDYLSYAINLILGLSIAGIGFEAKILSEDSFSPSGFGKTAFILSVVLLFLASAAGFACVFNRLKDFRDTATITRKKSKNEYDAELDELRNIVGILGKRTKCYFNLQAGLFSFGVVMLLISLSMAYQQKLF